MKKSDLEGMFESKPKAEMTKWRTWTLRDTVDGEILATGPIISPANSAEVIENGAVRELEAKLKTATTAFNMATESYVKERDHLRAEKQKFWSKCIELERDGERLRVALDLALYYVEGDATYEGVKAKIDAILAGKSISTKDDGK